MLKVRGYAAIFGNRDLADEVIDRGAFSEWIAANPAKSLAIFWNHSHHIDPLAKPIGKTTMLRQDRKGLYFEGVIADTPEGLEVQELLKAGAVGAASFAYKTLDRYQKAQVWHLKTLAPQEITAATINWGVNPKAYIEAVVDADGADQE